MKHSSPKVLLDLRMVEGPLHGIARYALELARHLPQLEPSWEFIGLTGPQGLPEGLGTLKPDMALHRCAQGFLSPIEQPALLWALSSLRPSLFHATSFSVPALWPGKWVVTLHDANHLALKHHYGAAQALYYRFIVRPRAEAASARITISQFSKTELAHHLRLSQDAFDVIPQGVDEAFGVPSREAVNDFKKRHQLPEAYFAVVGNSKRYKNLEVLGDIRAALPAPLVLLAGDGARTRAGNRPGDVELKPLSELELSLFYAGATALLFPSQYEGFGLPVLEAMASGCPVVAANAGALPEVVGDAGLLVAPNQPDAWLASMKQLAHNPAERAQWASKGLARANQFRWKRCAEETLAVYQRALGG